MVESHDVFGWIKAGGIGDEVMKMRKKSKCICFHGDPQQATYK